MAQMGPAAFVDEVGQVLENKQGVKSPNWFLFL